MYIYSNNNSFNSEVTRWVTYILIAFLACLAIVALYLITYYKPKDYVKHFQRNNNRDEGFSITSPAFTEGTIIPDKYTCVGDIAGKEFKIPIQISDPPIGTKSFALIMNNPDDPDAPNKNFIHWLVWNISPDTQFFDGSKSDTNVGYNSADQPTYKGPCPPQGSHRYFITVYALDTLLDLTKYKKVTESILLMEMKNHILGTTQLLGYYKKDNTEE